jgi:hypothetical protein
MPLARYALYAQHMDILVAVTWDCGDLWTASMRHIAKEGGCWVLSSATALQGSDIPASFPGRDQLFKDGEWINPGDAIAVKPGGTLVAGPLHEEKSILYVTIDAQRGARHMVVGRCGPAIPVRTCSIERRPAAKATGPCSGIPIRKFYRSAFLKPWRRHIRPAGRLHGVVAGALDIAEAAFQSLGTVETCAAC